jgi:hypothetical protein
MSSDHQMKIRTNCGGWQIAEGKTIRQGTLDDLLRGGFTLPQPENSSDGLVVLIRGAAGTGKSTLALQLGGNIDSPSAANGTGPTRFFSLEQDADELRHIHCRMTVHEWLAFLDLIQVTPHSQDGETDPLQTAVAELMNLAGCRDLTRAPRAVANFARSVSHDLTRHRMEKDPLTRARVTDELIDKIFTGPRLGSTQTLEPEAGLAFFPSKTGPEGGSALIEDPISSAYRFLEETVDRNAHTRWERPAIILDGLSTLSPGERGQIEVGELVKLLRERSLIGIIAYEPAEGEGEILDHQADVVIELRERHLTVPMEYAIHELHIKKSRYQDAALGWHQYKIRSYGFEIYPSLHFQVHSHLYMNKQLIDSLEPVAKAPAKPGDQRRGKSIVGHSIIETVLGGVTPGDSVALLGPRGAFKTTLTWDFLLRSGISSCPGGIGKRTPVEHGLLVSIIDNETNLRHNKRCPVAESCSAGGCRGLDQCLKHVFLFYQRPGCISASEFLYYLKIRLQMVEKTNPVKRLAFWDLTQLEHRFPLLSNDPMFVPALLDLFRMKYGDGGGSQMIKSIFMGAANAKLTKAISATADNVVFCWRDQIAGERMLDENDGKWSEILRNRRWTGGKDVTEIRRKEYLLLYVDRAAGRAGNEKKSLFAFAITEKETASENKQAVLAMPTGLWRASEFEILRDEVFLFHKAGSLIEKINGMQGFEDLPEEPPTKSGCRD